MLLTEAKTILMDEPTAALDQEGERELFLPLFERFLSEKRELVLVTHSMQLLQLFPGEIFRMKDGIIGGEKDGDSGS